MIKDTYIRKKVNQTIIRIILILTISIVAFSMYKYSLEGEENMAFNISKMVIISSAQTDNLILQNGNYTADVVQKNDIYLYFEKNENYNKEEMIKSITINNLKITEPSEIGTVKLYRTTMNENKTFEYIEKYEAENIVYMGGLTDNNKLETQIISNQGGTIYFSISNVNLGKITYAENENVEATGIILNKLNLKNNQIKFKVSFDIIMELESENKFKATVNLELPDGDILKNGVSKIEDTQLNNLVFKRLLPNK